MIIIPAIIAVQTPADLFFLSLCRWIKNSVGDADNLVPWEEHVVIYNNVSTSGSMANMAFKMDFGVRLTLNKKGKVLDFGHERLIERSCKVEHFFATIQSSLEILQDSIENSLLKKVYIKNYA